MECGLSSTQTTPRCSFYLSVVFSAPSLPATLSTALLSGCPLSIPDTFTDEVPKDLHSFLSSDWSLYQLTGFRVLSLHRSAV
jgi:hypothetical protein